MKTDLPSLVPDWTLISHLTFNLLIIALAAFFFGKAWDSFRK